MGTNSTDQELSQLPGVPGECFRLLLTPGPVTLSDEQRQCLLWVYGSMEHLSHSTEGYPQAVAIAALRWPDIDLFKGKS